jgi:tagaturonate epimerase
MTLRTDHLEADVLRTADGSTLQVRAAEIAHLAPFEGETRRDGDGHLLTGPLSPANAAALREAFEVLRPRPIGDTRTSVGTGDRLGLATAGQARAFRDQGAGLAPVLAQQSIREMDRLGRDALSVIDEATFGCLEEGWDGGYGADCDHIKTTEGIDRGLAAGFVTFTLDPGDHVVDVTGGITDQQLELVPWEVLGDDLESLHARYVGTVLDLGTQRLEITREAIDTAAVKYGAAVAEAARLFRHLQGSARHEVEAEIAVDETAWLTTFVEHHYMAGELARLGVEWFSFAPRYVDGFEKGVEFLGDEDELRENLTAHHAISRLHGGYKISLHSGSDKFSIYPLAVAATDGHVHLKTSGTSYLCALEVIARHDPELLAQIWDISRAAYARSRASYQVSAHEDRTPETLEGVDTAALIAASDSRQILHVGYGDSLVATDAQGVVLGERLRRVLEAHHAEYSEVLAAHIGRHLAPFAAAAGERAVQPQGEDERADAVGVG